MICAEYFCCLKIVVSRGATFLQWGANHPCWLQSRLTKRQSPEQKALVLRPERHHIYSGSIRPNKLMRSYMCNHRIE